MESGGTAGDEEVVPEAAVRALLLVDDQGGSWGANLVALSALVPEQKM